MLEKLFKLRENGTDAKTEVMAGITTFMTMAYILAVNPSILSATGMDSGAIFTSTALAAMIGTFLMAFFANYPFALAPGMGLNAYFAYTVVLGMGYKWEVALTAVFVEGIVFIVLSLTNIREAIFNAIPKNLKSAVSVGIGLFIAFIGLQNANIVVGGSTLLQLFSIDGYNSAKGVEASMSNVGITVILALIGVGITGILVIKNVKGNILWGILITWILGIICMAPLIKKFGKRNLVLGGAIICIAAQIILMINPENMKLVLAASIIRGLGEAPINGLTFTMLADVINYGHWKTGIRVHALIFSTFTVGQKFGGGVAGWAIGQLMQLSGFTGSVTETVEAVAMIKNLYIYGVILAWGLIAICMLVYHLDKEYDQVLAELK